VALLVPLHQLPLVSLVLLLAGYACSHINCAGYTGLTGG
jgi:hypothetical protein